MASPTIIVTLTNGLVLEAPNTEEGNSPLDLTENGDVIVAYEEDSALGVIPSVFVESVKVGCPFCDYTGPIVADYREEGVFIIEPLNPVVPGHVLVIPRRHVEHFATRLAVTGKVAQVAGDYARGRWDTDFNLITSKGAAATQTVSHLHFHLIPRSQGDGLALPWTLASIQAGP